MQDIKTNLLFPELSLEEFAVIKAEEAATIKGGSGGASVMPLPARRPRSSEPSSGGGRK